MSEDEQKTRRILCIGCNHLTTHVLRQRYSVREELVDDYREGRIEMESDEVGGVHVHRYSIWQCAGCTMPTLEHEVGVENSECEDNFEPGLVFAETGLDYEYLPKRSWEGESLRPKWFRKLSPELGRLYSEIVTCFNNGCLLLCTIGLRALIEGICKDKGIDYSLKLECQIDQLIKFLPSLNVIEALHDVRFAGNDAAHRLEALTQEKAREAIGIMEDLLNFLYDLDYKASQMNQTSKRAALKSAKIDAVQ